MRLTIDFANELREISLNRQDDVIQRLLPARAPLTYSPEFAWCGRRGAWT